MKQYWNRYLDRNDTFGKITSTLTICKVILWLSMATFHSCSEPEPEEVFGNIYFYAPESSCGVGTRLIGTLDGGNSFVIYADNQVRGCEVPFNQRVMVGLHQYEVIGETGQVWSGEVDVSSDGCEIVTLNCTNQNPQPGTNCTNTCIYANDGECDEGGLCGAGTDCDDCRNSGDAASVIFWTEEDCKCGNISVTVSGQAIGTITQYAPNGIVPTCGTNGYANTILPWGNYSYKATCDNLTWEGTFKLDAIGCIPIQIRCQQTTEPVASSPTVTTPETMFISSQGRQLSAEGHWAKEFLVSETTRFVFNMTSQYQVQAAIFEPSQYSAFTNNGAFNSISGFDKKFGYQTVTLSPGTYYVGVRNLSQSDNLFSVELDKEIRLPASDRVTFVDVLIQGSKTLQPGNIYWHEFTIQEGHRYFLDGCNTGLEVYTIPATSITDFKNRGQFQYYKDYSTTGGAVENLPGLWEYKLSPGTYYLAVVNKESELHTLTYHLEIWRVE